MAAWVVDTERAEDIAGIDAVHKAAFGGDYEAGVVATLRADGDTLLSLVAREGDHVVGHVGFSRLDARRGNEKIALVVLAPLAVAPSHQDAGVGSALVKTGLAWLPGMGVTAVVVRGHPTYYPRHGFSAELAKMISAPWSGPTYPALEFVPGAISAGPLVAVYPRAFTLPGQG
jgi:putative acetyltransferase